MNVLACIVVCIGMNHYGFVQEHPQQLQCAPVNAQESSYAPEDYQLRFSFCTDVVCFGYVLISIGRYKQVFACIGSNIDCRHPNSVPYCTSIHV